MSLNLIRDLDRDPDPSASPFEGLAYGITHNDSLGLPGGPFTVLAPFSRLPHGDAASAFAEGKMPIQQAFKAVLAKGYELSSNQETLIIDMPDLADGNADTVFFTEGGTNSVADAIAGLVNKVPTSVAPIIRFLRGAYVPVVDDQGFWNSRRPGIEAIFWKHDGQQVSPHITHPKVELHLGYWSPNFVVKSVITSSYAP